MKEVKKIDFSIGALTTLNSMKENVQDSILAALARVAWQPYFSNTKIKPLNEKENTFIIRPNDDFRLVKQW